MQPLEIRQLHPKHAGNLAALLDTASSQDREWFHPFEFQKESIETLLSTAKQDTFYGCLFGSSNLLAFYMLRGFDEGFESPMYGTFVAPKYRRTGIGRLLLYHAISASKLARYPSLLLKVYQDNIAALSLYSHAGFSEVRHIGNVKTMEKNLRLG